MSARHIALSLVLSAFAAASLQARDWKEHPAILTVSTAEDIYAIGDAHGDVEHLERVMKSAGLIADVVQDPLTVRWSGGKAVLVVTGDMMDKGPRILDVIRLLRTLREEAPKSGGRVILLAGNHEIEFLADPAAAKGLDSQNQFNEAHMKPAEVAECKGEIGEFLCSLPIGVKVNNWYFSHSGYTAGESENQLEAMVEKAFSDHGYAAKELIDSDSVMRAEHWIDAKLPAESEKQLLTDYTRALGVDHIVQGHVPSDVKFADGVKRNHGEMFQRYGKLFFIDTGMSRGVGDSDGATLYLPHASEQAIAICADGQRTLLWSREANQDAGHAAACGGAREPFKVSKKAE